LHGSYCAQVATLLRINGITGEFHDFWATQYEQGVMKDIEINSDKLTALAIIFFLVFCLVWFVSDLLALARHRLEFPIFIYGTTLRRFSTSTRRRRSIAM
jgi:Flp pilus assembly protein TadB